ncbi:hypothetical protein C8J57DRAFT_1235143 [Mycena rebaudengoi]|nr:hypothetical protein C8J57DRAFT_1235143 [Mycena rebaudengoi]
MSGEWRAPQAMGYPQPKSHGQTTAAQYQVDLASARVTGSTLSQMGQMKKDAKEQHEQLVALLETNSDLTGSDCSSVTGNLSSSGNRNKLQRGHQQHRDPAVPASRLRGASSTDDVDVAGKRTPRPPAGRVRIYDPTYRSDLHAHHGTASQPPRPPYAPLDYVLHTRYPNTGYRDNPEKRPRPQPYR